MAGEENAVGYLTAINTLYNQRLLDVPVLGILVLGAAMFGLAVWRFRRLFR